MNIVNIEGKTFEEMFAQFKRVADLLDETCEKDAISNAGNLLDKEAVCKILHISPRTLQTYRETGKIGFVQLDRKICYKASDVEVFLKRNYVNFNHE